MLLNHTYGKSTLVQVMAWCRQATSDYLSQCCPRSQSPYGITRPQWVNSLSPVKFEWNFRYVILKQILLIDDWIICCEIAQIWMSLDFTDDQSILVQVMAWCRQATSHYLSQCWPRSLSPYGITRPQWVKKNNLCWSICTLSWNTHLCRKFVKESITAICFYRQCGAISTLSINPCNYILHMHSLNTTM